MESVSNGSIDSFLRYKGAGITGHMYTLFYGSFETIEPLFLNFQFLFHFESCVNMRAEILVFRNFQKPLKSHGR
jgi:hypothetical protein